MIKSIIRHCVLFCKIPKLVIISFVNIIQQHLPSCFTITTLIRINQILAISILAMNSYTEAFTKCSYNYYYDCDCQSYLLLCCTCILSWSNDTLVISLSRYSDKHLVDVSRSHWLSYTIIIIIIITIHTNRPHKMTKIFKSCDHHVTNLKYSHVIILFQIICKHIRVH